ncbi:MAG: hypothetical protein A3J63_01135 [Candidatus Moranbacteria bacterium RIFCSPHIGHO2_02_FULL_40_12b]|nr:MAG: hypothetical protein A3J63_01135 [Candidatus Moranbacteria bacterium RIFCSPHIGHO2_02_FULL_40_12b]
MPHVAIGRRERKIYHKNPIRENEKILLRVSRAKIREKPKLQAFRKVARETGFARKPSIQEGRKIQGHSLI